ncbi:MAG TPA: fibronectin type III domain-containing protein [Candidatus Limnocylindrales bacterium]|nr:fibronectin type III domain-containing protein [Candidatus Limnocylindrales bacterium]
MSLRRLAVVTSAVVLAVAFNVGVASTARGAPTAPSNLRITASTSTSVSLAWDASKGGGTFWYCVQNGGAGCIRVDPPQTTLTRTQLLPGRTFTFSVYAVTSSGNRSASSNTVTFTTPPDTTAPSPPPTVSLQAVFPTRIYIQWTQSTDDLRDQVWYTVFHNGNAVNENQLGFFASTFFYLERQSTHTFRVDVRDGSGNVAQGNTERASAAR